ncbi:D-inositol-3-phosphate glycosyltransferase [uncultured archaeon]|nr:D-inositol-3-phosphate glycosyltransferase [uncultured archaeon]
MKIAMFTDSYLPNTDGVVSSILAFKQGLEKRGHTMYVFAPDADGQAKDPKVFRYHSVKFPPYPQYRAAVFPYVPADVAKKTGVQVVHSKAMVNMGLSAMNFASRASLPSVASLETMIPDGVHYIIKHRGAQQAGKKLAWGYLKWFYSNFDLVTAPSHHTQILMAENGIESIVLPSPVDTNFFKPNGRGEKMKRELGISGKKVVLAVGRIVEEKNYSLIVKAAAAMRDPGTVFLIVGRGPYLERLKGEIAAAGLQEKVKVAGFVSGREKLVDIYNAADVFAFASPFETQGLVQLEAMACGTPACILKDTAPAEAIDEGRNGFTFSDDPKDCAEKLQDCIEKKKKFSLAARKTVIGKYSVGALSGKLAHEYEKLIEGRGR